MAKEVKWFIEVYRGNKIEYRRLGQRWVCKVRSRSGKATKLMFAATKENAIKKARQLVDSRIKIRRS